MNLLQNKKKKEAQSELEKNRFRRTKKELAGIR